MRILMLAHSHAPWTPHFCRYFTARGNDLLVVSFAPFEIDGVDGINMEFVGIEPFNMYKNKHMFITRAPRVRKIVKRFKPDIVFAPYLVSNGLTAALSWKGPLVVSAVGGDVDDYMNRKGLRRILREETIRFICRRADIVNTVSQHLDDILIRMGVPAEKLLQIPYGVDLDTFHPAPEMPRSEATRLICTRKHEPLYDIPTVIDALAKLKSTGRKFHCTITCGGTRWEENKTRAKAAGLQEEEVTFTGNLPHQEIPGLLRQADIYIASTYFDGTSVALLEAMASGLLPVVTRINANIPWIEEGKTGLLFEPGEVDQLAEALAKAMDDAEMRKNIFEENRLRVDRDANMKRNHDRLYQAFEEIVAKYRR